MATRPSFQDFTRSFKAGVDEFRQKVFEEPWYGQATIADEQEPTVAEPIQTAPVKEQSAAVEVTTNRSVEAVTPKGDTKATAQHAHERVDERKQSSRAHEPTDVTRQRPPQTAQEVAVPVRPEAAQMSEFDRMLAQYAAKEPPQTTQQSQEGERK